MMFLFLVACVGFAGHEVSAALWRRYGREELSIHERVTSAAVMATAILLGATWAFAFLGRLDFAALLTTALVCAVTGGVLRWRAKPAAPVERPADADPVLPRALRTVILATVFVPLAAWTAFLLWRGAVTPPLSHDAVVYHLPRAAMFYHTGTYRDFHLLDARIDGFPANYELLLADILIVQRGDDRITEWLSTIFFLLALIAAAGLARRWWGKGPHLFLVVLLLCSAPVFLLQGAAIKNDLLVMYFFVAAFLFAGRWLSAAELPSAILALISIFIAAGLKPHGLLLGFALAPILIAGAVKGRRENRFGAREVVILAVVLAGSLLLGEYHYIHTLRAHRIEANVAQRVDDTVHSLTGGGYGDWHYLWQAPVAAWLAPFSTNDIDVYIPWTGKRWFWPRFDVHDSHYGTAVSVLALLLPLAVWLSWKDPDRRARRERLAISIAALIIVAVFLPRHTVIYGNVSGYPRYLMFVLILIVCWTVPPLFEWMVKWKGVPWARGTFAVAAVLFVSTAADVAVNDRYTPLFRVRAAAEHPGARGFPIYPPRGETIVDALAGPRDVIDLYCYHDSWIYPAMGPRLQRDLRFIQDAREVRPNAEWVAVDRRFDVAWGRPGFLDMGDWKENLGRGRPDVGFNRFVKSLLADPRFELIYLDEPHAQAAFHRRAAKAH